MNQIFLAKQKSILGIGLVSGYLSHPFAIWIMLDSTNIHFASFYIYKEWYHKSGQFFFIEYFNSKEIGSGQGIYMRINKLFPVYSFLFYRIQYSRDFCRLERRSLTSLSETPLMIALNLLKVSLIIGFTP